MSHTLESIQFIEDRDGKEAAIAFSLQSLRATRQAVLNKHGLILRRALIVAYLEAKRYYFNSKVNK